jgi:hypothetical protein
MRVDEALILQQQRLIESREKFADYSSRDAVTGAKSVCDAEMSGILSGAIAERKYGDQRRRNQQYPLAQLQRVAQQEERSAIMKDRPRIDVSEFRISDSS